MGISPLIPEVDPYVVANPEAIRLTTGVYVSVAATPTNRSIHDWSIVVAGWRYASFTRE
ncbi:MAG: hypothetical protein U0163_21035 [Gemmatimonadaceae bacterium]